MLTQSSKRRANSSFNLSWPRSGALRAWLVRHLQSFFFSLGVMARSPLSTLITAAVLGVALALPAGLYLLLDNVARLSGHLDNGNRISVFLTPASEDQQAKALAERLRGWQEVERVTVISRDQALAEFRAMSGFADVLDAFEDANPLPPVLSVEPTARFADPPALEALAASLARLPEVDTARFDLQWLKRFEAFVEIVRRGVFFLGALLALGTVLIIGNTIRLSIENRREEIEIARLFGATNAFIRRPFLYGGLLYGLGGGLLAWGMLAGGFVLLSPAVGRLLALYGSNHGLSGLDLVHTLGLLATGAALGLAGAWVAVGRHLNAIEPD